MLAGCSSLQGPIVAISHLIKPVKQLLQGLLKDLFALEEGMNGRNLIKIEGSHWLVYNEACPLTEDCPSFPPRGSILLLRTLPGFSQTPSHWHALTFKLDIALWDLEGFAPAQLWQSNVLPSLCFRCRMEDGEKHDLWASQAAEPDLESATLQTFSELSCWTFYGNPLSVQLRHSRDCSKNFVYFWINSQGLCIFSTGREYTDDLSQHDVIYRARIGLCSSQGHVA